MVQFEYLALHVEILEQPFLTSIKDHVKNTLHKGWDKKIISYVYYEYFKYGWAILLQKNPIQKNQSHTETYEYFRRQSCWLFYETWALLQGKINFHFRPKESILSVCNCLVFLVFILSKIQRILRFAERPKYQIRPNDKFIKKSGLRKKWLVCIRHKIFFMLRVYAIRNLQFTAVENWANINSEAD